MSLLDGFGDFVKTPEGQGLLSAVAGYAAGAQKGMPLNNLGRGGLAGLQGFASAQDRELQQKQEAQMRLLREQQLQQAKYQNEAMATERQLGNMAANFYRPATKATPERDGTTVDEYGQVAPTTIAAVPESAGGFDSRGFLSAARSINPMAAAKFAKSMIGEQDWKESKQYDPQGNIIHGYVNVKAENPASTFIPAGGSAERQKAHVTDEGGQLTFRNPITGEVVGSAIGKTATPDTVMKEGGENARWGTQSANSKATNATTVRGQNMVNARAVDAAAQLAKAPAGYRYKEDGSMEAIPGGPADAKTQALDAQKLAGVTDVNSAVATLRDAYNRLESGGGITSTGNSAIRNIGASTSSSGLGQMVGKALGTNNQSARNDIEMTRPALLASLMKATGMSAKQIDSNAELKLWMKTATDPTLDVEANRRALANIERKYMSGQVSPDNSQTPPAPQGGSPKPMISVPNNNPLTFSQDKEMRYQEWLKKNGGAK